MTFMAEIEEHDHSSGVREFIEDFALTMEGAGMHRMSARVFAAVLSSEEAGMTARDLADLLQVSPAAVSGAVRQLETMRFLHRRRLPGQRADQYALGNEFWHEAVASKTEVFDALREVLDRGAVAVGDGSAASARLSESSDFFIYLSEEIPKLVEHWKASRG